jgi:hypothetical protein
VGWLLFLHLKKKISDLSLSEYESSAPGVYDSQNRPEMSAKWRCVTTLRPVLTDGPTSGKGVKGVKNSDVTAKKSDSAYKSLRIRERANMAGCSGWHGKACRRGSVAWEMGIG